MTAQAGDTTSSLARRKDALRRELRGKRRSLPVAARRIAAEKAATHLARFLRARGLRRVAIYLATGAELDTRALARRLADARFRLYAPKIRAGFRLDFVALRPPLGRNRHGIPEPLAPARAPRLDAIVVPLVGFDAAGRRLGMGGGYYDRLLARRRGTRPLAIGYAYSLQQAPQVPAGPLDVPLRAIATERGVIRPRR